MVRRNSSQGFSRARPRGVRTARELTDFRISGLAVAVLLLAGCATQTPPVGPWGYDFALGSFRDVRPNDAIKLMNVVPFRTDQMMASWQRQVGRNIFYSQPGLLDVVLEEFETTQTRTAFALSMQTHLRGRDSQGRVVADVAASCSAVHAMGPGDVGDSTQQAVDDVSLRPLTRGAMSATIWQKVLDSCVRDLAIQFGNALSAGVSSASR